MVITAVITISVKQLNTKEKTAKTKFQRSRLIFGALHHYFPHFPVRHASTRVEVEWENDRKLRNDPLCCPTKYNRWVTIALID